MCSICSRSKGFHLGLSREPWCPLVWGILFGKCWGLLCPGQCRVTFKLALGLEGFSSVAVGSPPRCVVDCAVLAHTKVLQTSPSLCLSYLRSHSEQLFTGASHLVKSVCMGSLSLIWPDCQADSFQSSLEFQRE